MLSSALSVLLGATVALASVVSVFERSDLSRTRCSTTLSDDQIIEAEKNFRANKVSRSLAERALGSTVIRMYFHVISADETPEGGDIPFV